MHGSGGDGGGDFVSILRVSVRLPAVRSHRCLRPAAHFQEFLQVLRIALQVEIHS